MDLNLAYVLGILIATLGGAAVGLEREWSGHASGPTARFALNWEQKVLSQYGDSTAINYRTHIRKHLVPFFGEYPMKDLNPEMVQQFVSCSAVSAKLPETFASRSRACGPRQKRGLRRSQCHERRRTPGRKASAESIPGRQ
jgi:integrase-like protein